jgi:hypothetical protein
MGSPQVFVEPSIQVKLNPQPMYVNQPNINMGYSNQGGYPQQPYINVPPVRPQPQVFVVNSGATMMAAGCTACPVCR